MKAIGTLFIGLSLLSMLIGGTILYLIAIIVIVKLVHLFVTKAVTKGNKKSSQQPPILTTNHKEPRKDPKHARQRINRKPVV
jgi:predicted lipid-binding transport protein (Tim44 family)